MPQFSKLSINLLNNITAVAFPFGLHIRSDLSYSKNSYFDTAILLAPPSSSYIQQDFISSLVHLTLDNLETFLSLGFCGTFTSIFHLSTPKILPSLKDGFCTFGDLQCYCPNCNSPTGGSFYSLPLSRYTVARFIFLDKTTNHGIPFLQSASSDFYPITS